MTEPTRHELNQFLCNRCNKPDAELFGMMVSSNEGRWVSYEDYARLKAENAWLKEAIADSYKAVDEMEKRFKELEAEFEMHPMAIDNARLKAEVERLDGLCKQLSRQQSDISCENIMLRKAGDALENWIAWECDAPAGTADDIRDAWNAAKEGKQSHG
jgi:hypothetical protein